MVKLQLGMASPSPISLGLLLYSAISLSLQAPITTQVSRLNAPSSTGQELAVSYPSRVDSQGNHLSYTLRGTSGNSRNKRDITDDNEALYFRVDAFGKDFILNVSANSEFVSESMAVEYVGHGGSKLQQPNDFEHCHHTGHIMGAGGKSEGWVAISNCHGLHGVIAASSGYYFIEPVDRDGSTGSQQATGQRHIVYRNPVHDRNSGPSCAHAQEASQESLSHELPSVRSKATGQDAEEQSDHRLRRAVVRERYIETAIVADRTMLEKHGRKSLEAYLYSLMNVVSHLYKDPSIGHAIRVVLVKTIILETDQPGLSLSADAHGSLGSFCQWQRTLNDGRSPNHDIAVLITHRNICETRGTNCGTLGMAKQGGVCNPARSCNINEDSGLRTAFTIAHEIGHNLGLRHDGDPMLQCDLEEHYLMAPSFADSANPHHWSRCSRVQLENFLRSSASECLDNPPSSGPFTTFSGSPPLPGMEYSFLEQCQLLLGPSATHCPGMPDECQLLWCEVDGRRCAHQHSPPAPGTECTRTSGDAGVCYQGECVDYASVLVPVDGGWGEWGPWTECSRSCGTGVQYGERECNSPLPANGGSYCLGPWRRYQTCQTHRCPGKTPDSYRQELCQSDPPHNRYSEWEAPTLEYIFWFKLDPCRHHCLPKGEILLFTKAQLPDGAPCITPVDHAHSIVDHAHPDRAPSQGVCIDGECVPVGCDGELYGIAHRDECGVWCGNGTSCVQLSGQYSDVYNPKTYTYYNAVTIPEGSANIHIEQTELSLSDFIAAKTASYSLNGDWKVVSDLLYEYWFAGAMWFYEKPPNARSYLRTEGPINESVTVQLLAVTKDTGLHYSFSVPKEGVIPLLEESEALYYWDTVGGRCEGVCGEGVRRREVRCVMVEEGSNVTMDDAYCDAAVRPMEVEACPLESCHWATEQWTECDAVCGEGSQTRTVLCQIRNEDGTCTAVEDSRCDPDTRPPESQTCSLRSCLWVVGQWTECDAVCGEGSQTRSVSCRIPNGNGTSDIVGDSHCNHDVRPPETKTCSRASCLWVVSQWTECDAVCGEGSQTRSVSCRIQNGNGTSDIISGSHCNHDVRPPEAQTCNIPCQWSTGQWTECDAFCGEGSQSRSVACQKQNRNGTLVSIDAAHCERVSRPSETQSCQAESCQNFQWVASEWSECDGECGDGSQSRTISCQHQNGTSVPDHLCSWQEKPRGTNRTCSTGKRCPPPTAAPTDPECVNTETNFFCATIVRVSLCRLYGRDCCKSCAGAE